MTFHMRGQLEIATFHKYEYPADMSQTPHNLKIIDAITMDTSKV